jgi:predicted lactoylglutathione lyase
MLQRLFHVNICVTDMERSIRFYQDLGFTKVNDFTLNDPSVGDALGVKANKLRGVFMRLGSTSYNSSTRQRRASRIPRSTTLVSAVSPLPWTTLTGLTNN